MRSPLSVKKEQKYGQQRGEGEKEEITPSKQGVVRSAAKSWASKKYFQRQIEGKRKKQSRAVSMLSAIAPPQVVMKSPGLLGEKK